MIPEILPQNLPPEVQESLDRLEQEYSQADEALIRTDNQLQFILDNLKKSQKHNPRKPYQ